MYEIRLCYLKEKHLLLKFLHDSWQNDHIFVLDEKILNFQHKSEKHYNFVVAFHKIKKEFHGVLGFMSPSHYSDKIILKKRDIWIGIWKVNSKLSEDKSIGLKLISFLEKKYEPKYISGTGLVNDVIPLYRLMGFKTCKINHWFMLNEKKQEFKLVGESIKYKFKSKKHFVELNGKELDLNLLKNLFFLNNKVGTKNFKYVKQRYFNHPYYIYKCYALYEGDNLIGAIIGRKVTANDAFAFRITDFWIEIENNKSVFKFLQTLMNENNYEYIDFMEYGWNKLDLEINGFLSNSKVFYVPHYFEPFSYDKIDVTIAYKGEDNFICTKGDCDLDRPRIKPILL